MLQREATSYKARGEVAQWQWRKCNIV